MGREVSHRRLLTELGLSASAEEAYINLLLHNDFHPSESVLNELEDCELIHSGPSGVTALSAASRLNDELAALVQRTDSLRQAIRAIESIEGHDDSTCCTTSVSTYEIGIWYESLIKNAKHTLFYTDHIPFFHSASIPKHYLERLQEQVVSRTIYEAGSLTSAKKLDDILWCVDQGEQARVAARCPFRMLIADSAEALIFVQDPDDSIYGIRIRAPHLVEVLILVFETFWESGFPITPRISSLGTAPVLDPEVIEVLHLLSTGLTDEAIARRLGISQRTVSRRISSALAYFRVDTRFQLGLKVADLVG